MAAKKTSRKKKSYAAVVGLAGAGKVAKRAALSHLSDFIESIDGEILWVIPLTEDMSQSLETVTNELWEDQARYMLVTDETYEDPDWEENAESIVTTEDDVYAAVVSEVEDYGSDDARLIIILDEEHDADVELVEAAMNADIVVHDLTSGLAKLEVTEEDDDDEDEDDAEGDEPDDDEPEEDDVDEELELPERAQKWLDKGNAEKAAAALEKDMDNDDLKAFADKLGVERKKGAWAKTIAKDVIDFLIYQEAGDGADDEPEEEEKVEEEPKRKPAKKAAKRSRKPEPKDDDEPLTGEGEAEVVDAELLSESVGEIVRAAPMSVHPGDLLHVLASIANAHDLKTAKEFHKFAKEQGLIG